MTIVMEMSTDANIVGTQLDPAWPAVTARYTWAQIGGMNLNIANGASIVVVAHGNGNEIGNQNAGVVDIDALTFLADVQGNMAAAAVPAAIYISTCNAGIAQFAANVRIQAGLNQIWGNTRIYGHANPVAGNVVPPNDIRWYQMFP